MLSVNVQTNFARTLVAFPRTRVYGHGSRGCGEDPHESMMAHAFFLGETRAFSAIQNALELRTEEDLLTLSVKHLHTFEDDLRENYNDASLIHYPAYAAAHAEAIKHRIPDYILGGWEMAVRAVFNPSPEECAALLDTDTYKEGITSAEAAETFAFQLYMVAALKAIGMVVPAWECDHDTYHTDKISFYESIVEHPEYEILTTPPDADRKDEVRRILEQAVDEVSYRRLERSDELRRMGIPAYRAFWAHEWLRACGCGGF